jgi:DnaJ-class molecular chaperone
MGIILSTVIDNKCITCDGKGKYPSYRNCYECHGTGYYYCPVRRVYEIKEKLYNKWIQKIVIKHD